MAAAAPSPVASADTKGAETNAEADSEATPKTEVRRSARQRGRPKLAKGMIRSESTVDRLMESQGVDVKGIGQQLERPQGKKRARKNEASGFGRRVYLKTYY